MARISRRALGLLLTGLLESMAQTSSHDGLTETIRELHASQLPGFIEPRSTRPMVDPDTPVDKRKTQDHLGDEFELVFSDEFTKNGRSFAAGDDPYWTAVDHFNPTTSDLEYYSPRMVTTEGGNMVITATMEPNDGHPYTSGMVTSWNQMCFQGGIVEVKVQLPGTPQRPGFWPAVWMMGNLARAGYTLTTDAMWPWSYTDCDGISGQWQRLSECNDSAPEGYRGRGAPEFDILETNTCPTSNEIVGVSDLMRCPNDTKSTGPYKAGPRLFSTMHFTPKNPANKEYDEGFEFGDLEVTHKNTDGDELHDFIGATTAVDESLWEFPHVYRLEWYPSRASQGGGTYGYVRWELDGRLLANIDAYALRGRIGEGGDGSKYVISDRKISQEPMYMLFNVAISEFWKHQDPAHPLQFPGQMKVDYVRVYQNADNPNHSCDPPLHPTSSYIKEHPTWYDGTSKPPVMCDPDANPPQTCPGPGPGLPGPPCPKCGNPACECPAQGKVINRPGMSL